MGSLIPQFEALARDGHDALLLVDEADSLSIGALNRLRKLTSVRVEGRAALHVVLIGRSTPAGIGELERIGRPLNIGAPVRMEPLDAGGTHEYILERLRRAGWTGRPAFDACTTAEIHARCQGNPGRINRLCGRILLQLYMQGRHDIDAEIVRAVDELLRSELIGESPALELPRLAPASPDASRCWLMRTSSLVPSAASPRASRSSARWRERWFHASRASGLRNPGPVSKIISARVIVGWARWNASDI